MWPLLILCMCAGATAVGGGFYTEFTLPALATSFNCSGEEARLYECQFEKMPGTNCIHDAAVICQGNFFWPIDGALAAI